MQFVLKPSLFVLACFFIVACGQSGDKENQTTTDQNVTNTSESSLTVTPNVPTTSSTNLQDIWVLDSINSKPFDSSLFHSGTPFLDFNLDKKTVSGHSGCNGINGKLKVTKEKLIFDSLVITKQTCNDKGFEKKLLKGLKSRNLGYKIINDELYLNIELGTVYTFRRIRRK
jgi:heat shock protein HslJ